MKKINHFDYAAQIVRSIPQGVLLTTKAEKVNSMVIGWGTYGVEWGKPMFVVYVREGRFTRSQLDAHPEFTVNLPLESHKLDPKIMNICGMHSGRDLDKVSEAGLTLVPGGEVDVPGPVVKLSGTPGSFDAPSPLLGQHNREILGLSEDEEAALLAGGTLNKQ